MTAFEELVHAAAAPEAGPGAVARQELLTAARSHWREQMEEGERRHRAGESGGNVIRSLSAGADRLMHGLFTVGLSMLSRGPSLRGQLAFCAMGGYGRSELHPHSDLDVCLLAERDVGPDVEELNSFMLTTLWDIGFEVGYTLHTIPEAVDLLGSDDRAYTSFMQARLLAGDSTVFARLKLNLQAMARGGFPQRYIRAKIRERTADLAPPHSDLYTPEPDLKQGKGGLRDYHAAIWTLALGFGLDSLEEAEAREVLTPDESLDIAEALDFIWRVRNELHFATGRSEDRLTIENQRKVAAGLGYGSPEQPDIYHLMQDYYAAAASVRNLLRIAGRSCHVSSFSASGTVETKQPGLRVEAGEVHAGEKDPGWFSHRPVRLMSIFWHCGRHGAELSRPTERLVRANLGLINDAFRGSDVVRRFFTAICNMPTHAGHALRQASRAGVLQRYVPEFADVENVIRYEDFHLYPVHEHTLRAIEALAKIEELEGAVGRCLNGALHTLTDPYILVMAILFHDLGKASGEVHVDESARLCRVICQRMGMPSEDEERIAALVRNHVLMTNISQYRDIDDDDIITGVAEKVKTEQRLRALFLLSYADLSAVGPNVWNEWKGALLMRLYLRTLQRLMGHVESAGEEHWESAKAQAVRDLTPPELRGQVERHLRGMGERYAAAFSADQIALHIACAYEARQKGLATRHSPNEETNQTELVICAEDRPALFATLAGCFAAQLLDVNGAAVFTTPDGLALDCFSISDPKRRRPLTPNEVEGLRRVLRSVLFDGRDVQGLVDDSRKRLFALLQPRAHTGRRVDFDNQASRTHTIIDIEAGDRTGLLYDMTRAMAEAGLDIFAARITTDARRVRDSFYVRKGKRKIVSPDEQARIRQGILKAIEPPAPPNVKGEYA